MTDTIESLREEMDDITLQMILSLKTRTDIAARIGAIKRQRGLAVADGARESALRRRMLSAADAAGLDPDVAARFLNHLVAESSKVQSAGSPTHLAIFKRAKEMESAGERIIHMEVGEPDFDPPPEAGDALLEGFRRGYTKYGLPSGMERLRQALSERVAAEYGVRSHPQRITVTPGARFAVFAAITALLHPGDEIIIPEPTWPAYHEAAAHCGAKPTVIHTTMEDRWEPSLEEIEAVTTSQTRMIVLCYPSNPTGRVLPESKMDAIMEYAKKRNLYVLSDEIYSDYSRTRPKSVLEYQYENSVVTQSFSKSHAMMGFRIGYAVASQAVSERLARVSALCLTGVAGVIQYAALKSLAHDTSKNAKVMLERLDSMSAMAADAGLEFVRPDGAMYIFGRLPGVGGMELVERCLKEGLAIAPGAGFGHYPDFVRLSAGTGQFRDGMNILRNVSREYKWRR